TDWRDGGAHADAALSASVYDSDYLEGRIEAGENYDFFYASEAARSDQARSSISDGAYGEPWIYRAKDVRNFWSRLHYDRPGGVRALAPTNWAAQSKPFWFIELGCPAIDKGANAPNLFIDAKSAESAEPPFSSGLRDDLIQRRALEAYLRYWDASGANNPISAVTGARMLERSFAWCWDARPYPAYPSRGDVWTDGESWRRGHWLNGRAGLSGLAEVVADICARAGVEDVDVAGLEGAVSGYVIDAPASARAALEPLMAAYDFHASERDGRFVFAHRGDTADASLDEEAFPATGVSALYAERADGAEAAVEARVRFVDAGRDYLIANVSARRLDRAEGGVLSLDAPLALDAANAERIAQRALADARAKNEALQIELGPASLALEPGDRVTFGGGVFTIERTEDTGARAVSLRQARARAPVSLVAGEASPDPLVFAPAPDACVLDLPPLPGAEDDDRPLLAVYAAPWRGVHAIHAGPTLEAATLRGAATQPACMGALVWALWPGPVDRWDQGNRFRARLVGGAVASVSEEALLNGANAFALEGESGEWEIVQARDAVLVAPSEYEFSTLLRGRLGSAHAMRAPHPVGARIVKLDARLARFGVASHEWGDLLTFAAPPPGAGLSDPRTATLEGALPNAGRRAWAPAHVRARRMVSGDVAISWVRRAHKGGDTWAAGDAPLPMVEAYALDILDGSGAIIRSVAANEASFLYTAGAQVADFGSPPTSLRVRVAQLGESGATGLNTELTIPL
ncbi:MAG: glycoside hydrolase TIM-barrel-like domain-containing protein, partial [Hyphomonadaceae bacterium]